MLLSLALLGTATAADLLFQDTITGGVSVDASGVSTSYQGGNTPRPGDDLVVEIPSAARIEKLYLVVHAKRSGFRGGLGNVIKVNDHWLSEATLTHDRPTYRVYELDRDVFQMRAAGSYAYRETDSAEANFQNGAGVAGASLVATYSDPSRTGRRHVAVYAGENYAPSSSFIIGSLPTAGTTGEAVVSVGIVGACSDTQGHQLFANGHLLSTFAGGRDDGNDVPSTPRCSDQDWNSLITVGSMGFGNRDTWRATDGDCISPAYDVGTDGITPLDRCTSGEPTIGSLSNSRKSDELYLVAYDESGTLTIRSEGSGTTGFQLAVVAIEMDSDEDGLRDAIDNCPLAPNPEQADLDGDHIGDLCDACPNDDANDADDDGVCGGIDLCDGHDDRVDSDDDGVPDGCDTCPGDRDTDLDGVCDLLDACAGHDDLLDADTDGVPDGCDTCPNDAENDDDVDGVCGDIDACPGFDDNIDSDDDGLPDACDVCPVSTVSASDSDSDGVCDDVDICDGHDDNADADADAVPDGCDPCRNDPLNDADHDGVCGDLDRCPGSHDALDADDDGIPNGCDTCPTSATNDSDDDGVCDDADICEGHDDAADADADGTPDGCDTCPNDAENDADDDGVCGDVDLCDGDDATGDADADGVCDPDDLCAGDDAIGDADDDGICDDLDLCDGDDATGDADGDGICDDLDLCDGDDVLGDADGDGVCDDGSDDDEGGRCGCAAAPSSQVGWLFGLIGLVGLRRRR